MSLFGGCSTVEIETIPIRQIEAYPGFQKVESVGFAAEAIATNEDNMRYFGMDLLSEGILPVFVLVKNFRPNGSLLIDPVNLTLGLQGGSNQAALPNNAPSSTEATLGNVAGATAAVGLVTVPVVSLVALPAMLGVVKKAADSESIRHNLATKRLTKQTASPGEVVYGFVYFDISDIEIEVAPFIIVLRVHILGSGLDTEIRLNLEEIDR